MPCSCFFLHVKHTTKPTLIACPCRCGMQIFSTLAPLTTPAVPRPGSQVRVSFDFLVGPRSMFSPHGVNVFLIVPAVIICAQPPHLDFPFLLPLAVRRACVPPISRHVPSRSLSASHLMCPSPPPFWSPPSLPSSCTSAPAPERIALSSQHAAQLAQEVHPPQPQKPQVRSRMAQTKLRRQSPLPCPSR